MNIETIKTRLDLLTRLKISAQNAAAQYNEALAKAAEDSQTTKAVLNKYITAQVGDSEKARRQRDHAEQLVLMFDNV